MGFSAIVAAAEEMLTRSPTLRLASLGVVEAPLYPRETIGGHLNSACSAVEPSDDPLLDVVRTRLACGALFPVDRKSWAGRASDKRRPAPVCAGSAATACAVCDLRIHNPEMEYEVAGGPTGPVFAHLQCYLVWRQESEAMRLRFGL